MKKVLILGSTGSIGVQALEVIGASGELRVVGLSANSDADGVVAQAREHGVPTIALARPEAAASGRRRLEGRGARGRGGRPRAHRPL